MLCAGIALLASRRARARFVPVAAAAALVAFGAAGCRADAFVARGDLVNDQYVEYLFVVCHQDVSLYKPVFIRTRLLFGLGQPSDG
jgi:hypothetical protein